MTPALNPIYKSGKRNNLYSKSVHSKLLIIWYETHQTAFAAMENCILKPHLYKKAQWKVVLANILTMETIQE
jgi:hypothetical protein